MDRVLKNEWVATSGSGGDMDRIVTKVHHNYVTLYHEPKSASWGTIGIGVVFVALLFFAFHNLLKFV
jgi:hypothetical protein